MQLRFLRATPAVAVALVLLAAPAWADGSADAWNNGSSVGAGASTSGSSGGGPDRGGSAGGGGGKPACTYAVLDPDLQAIADQMATSGWSDPKGTGPGAWQRKVCTDSTGFSSSTVLWVAQAVDLAALAQQALQNTPIPSPVIGMSPAPGQRQVVNVPTWLWIERSGWAPASAVASTGGVTVTATATPQSVTWDMGNGDTVSCDGPGTPYDQRRGDADQRPSCSYTYRHSSAQAPGGRFAVTATVVWYVVWSATGMPGGGDLGTAPRSETVPVRVAEIQSVNRPAHQGG